jgi:hypothetical protein
MKPMCNTYRVSLMELMSHKTYRGFLVKSISHKKYQGFLVKSMSWFLHMTTTLSIQIESVMNSNSGSRLRGIKSSILP